MLVTNLPIYFSALLASKSVQDPCKFTLNSAAYRPTNLKFYRRFEFICVLNLNAADFKPQPTYIEPAAARRAILAAHAYRRILQNFFHLSFVDKRRFLFCLDRKLF